MIAIPAQLTFVTDSEESRNKKKKTEDETVEFRERDVCRKRYYKYKDAVSSNKYGHLPTHRMSALGSCVRLRGSVSDLSTG